MNIPIAYEDEWLLVADKPAGLLVVPTPRNEPRTLSSILNQGLKTRGITYCLRPCHRLDRDTSGLIIYAKTKSIEKKMFDIFKARKIKKSYLTFLQGILPKTEGMINTRIEGLSALTTYRVIQRRKNFTVAKVIPFTGRTNQIRIHFKAIGHPVVGDDKFAFRKDYQLKAKRLCLHAASLEFAHPVTGKAISVSSPVPEYMLKFLEKKDN